MDPSISINAETLLDVIEVVKRSPAEGLQFLQSDQIDKNDLQAYKWNGLNLWHLVHLYRCSTNKHNEELLALYNYINLTMPDLQNQSTKCEVSVYFINTGMKDKLALCDHRQHMLHYPSDRFTGLDQMVIYTDCGIGCKASNALVSKLGEHHMSIRPNLKRNEFLLYLYSKFGETFPRNVPRPTVPDTTHVLDIVQAPPSTVL